MTLISEQLFKPYSSCHPSFASSARVPPDGCACQSLAARSHQAEGPEGVRKRLGRLLDKDIAQLEDGESAAKLLKRGKLIARWARAVKDITPAACAHETKAGTADVAQAPAVQPSAYPWERTASVPLGVEAFRTAVAKELSLIRNKKENIP